MSSYDVAGITRMTPRSGDAPGGEGALGPTSLTQTRSIMRATPFTTFETLVYGVKCRVIL